MVFSGVLSKVYQKESAMEAMRGYYVMSLVISFISTMINQFISYGNAECDLISCKKAGYKLNTKGT